MRLRAFWPTIAVHCCAVVALTLFWSGNVAAQGMVVPRGPVCSMGHPTPGIDSAAAPCFRRLGSVIERTSSVVRADLADRVVRYEVTETFTNHGPRLEEADYLFPLPAGAAFQDLKLSINGEMVAGEALSAAEARGVYEEIVRRQRDPALVEWMGAGLLRARIFPIASGEEKKVVVRFQTVAQREGDALRIDYAGAGEPSRVGVVAWAPRPINAHGGSGDVSRGDPDPTPAGWSGFVLSYSADDGYGTPYSPTHALVTDHDGSHRTARIDGAAHNVTILLPLTRRATAAVTMLPYATGEGLGFALITLAPPTVRTHPTPRDVTFVLDVSGSMAGRKLEQARAAGRELLATLTPQDRFRLIDFSSDVRTFRDEYERATPEHVREAQKYLDELEADGSTNIEAALAKALAPPAEASADGSDERRFPLTLFITDGEPTVGQRDPGALVQQAVGMLGHTRLFTFGLGSDVNTSLIEQLALKGHGTAQFVRPDESVERAVSLVAQRLADPVITDVAVHTEGVRLRQILPEQPSDLFAGQDLVLLARYEGSGRTELRFTGRTPDGPVSWASTVDFPERERANPFVARLWATQKIGYLEAERHRVGATPELDAELKDLGDRFGIPTELTSYLVREPAVANGIPVPTPMRVGAAGGVARNEADVGGGLRLRGVTAPIAGAAGTRGDATADAAKEFYDAKTAAAQRGAISLTAADSVASTGAGVGEGTSADASPGTGRVRHAGDATFVQRDGVWTDTRYQSGVRVIRVQAFSDAYFAVLQLAPALRSAFAVGDRVLAVGRAVAVEVSPAGVTRLADADAAAVRAGW
jgi:Ca-activated chloride channel homolog